MPAELITVSLFRDVRDEPWGFNITGGKAFDEPLSISHIHSKSIAERLGLKIEDILIKINGEEAEGFTYEDACEEIAKGEDSFDMVIERSCTGRKTSYEKSSTAFSIVLGQGKTEVFQDSEAFLTNRVEMER
ncbi:hypothetical protein TCAL_09449 [Tigriopus californicus]|uniref:PDZ domain-containing protein n=2 Tax=Tigriopus californicus TaxID=6832 RepID=A0A553PTQ9_TIGCA|nr:hypothetical protein TCAL_09449 [Tigriopus californicus]|eukprot:TCALIF_09449-PA protein Name:"Similar to PDLIM2 PDZ and LIM domain protein 2 (Homo sapiens)" AED:0.16 eAED:0.16 QI:2/1/0.33/1/1/1/3/3/131